MNLKSTTKVDTNKYELEIEVPADDFNAAVNAAYRKEVKNINVPGFRKEKHLRLFAKRCTVREFSLKQLSITFTDLL